MNWSEDLKAFVDGELDQARSGAVTQAMVESPDLAREVESIRSVGEGIKALAVEPQPVGFERTLAAVGKPRGLGWPLRLAMAVPILLVVVFAMNRGESRLDAASEVATMRAAAPGPDGRVVYQNADKVKAKALDDDGMNQAPSDGGGAEGLRGRADSTLGVPMEEAQISGKDQFKAELGSNAGGALVNGARDIIKTSSFSVKVVNVETAQKQTERLVSGLGGFVASTTSGLEDGELPSVSMTIRVPAKQFDSTNERLKAMGELVPASFSSNSQDVSLELADMEARLKVMKAEEDSYVTMLRAARKVGELLEIKERLSSVRQEIESLDAQRRTMKGQAVLSTITVTFIQRPGQEKVEKPSNWSEDTWAGAVAGLKSAGRWLGQAIIVAFVYSPIWLPFTLGIYWLSRRSRRL